MNHRERFIATPGRRPVDRLACWLGMPVTEALPALFTHFGVGRMAGLKRRLNDDVWPVEVPDHHPPANIAARFTAVSKDNSGPLKV